MKIDARFEKVSWDRAMLDWNDVGEKLRGAYDALPLPQRGTQHSAGYDICSPFDVHVEAGKPFTLYTGLRCIITKGWFLMMAPRSGLGFRYGLRLANTVGIIDSDYADAVNEGHIAARLIADESFDIHAGDRILQGILMPYGMTSDDCARTVRTGGLGSTGV